MTFIITIILFYFGLKLFLSSRAQLNKIRFYSRRFRISFPIGVSDDRKKEYIDRLVKYDIPNLPEDKLLDFIAARLRNMDLPTGTVLWMGKESRYI